MLEPSDLRSGRSTSSPNRVERNRVCGLGSPVVGGLALGGFEDALVDQALGLQLGDQGVGGAGGQQDLLAAVDVLLDAEQAEVFSDLGHHGVDGGGLDGFEPSFRRGNAKVIGGEAWGRAGI